MKNTVKLSDIGARTMHVVRFVRRFFSQRYGFLLRGKNFRRLDDVFSSK